MPFWWEATLALGLSYNSKPPTFSQAFHGLVSNFYEHLRVAITEDWLTNPYGNCLIWRSLTYITKTLVDQMFSRFIISLDFQIIRDLSFIANTLDLNWYLIHLYLKMFGKGRNTSRNWFKSHWTTKSDFENFCNTCWTTIIAKSCLKSHSYFQLDSW